MLIIKIIFLFEVINAQKNSEIEKKESISTIKQMKKQNECSILIISPKNKKEAKIHMIIDKIPKKVLANILLMTILLKEVGVEHKYSNVPCSLSRFISPIAEKQRQDHKVINILLNITEFEESAILPVYT